MTNTNTRFQPGQLIILSEGSYSDYSIIAPVTVLRSFNSGKVTSEFNTAMDVADRLRAAAAPTGEDRATRDASTFTQWLIKNGYIQEIACKEWHLGSGYNLINTQIRHFAGSISEQCEVCKTTLRSWELTAVPTGKDSRGYPINQRMCSMCQSQQAAIVGK